MAEVFFVTDNVLVGAIHNMFEEDTYQIDRNELNWKNYKGQSIITFCMFDIHLSSNMRRLLQWVGKDNMDYRGEYVNYKKYYFLGMVSMYGFKGPLMEILNKECNIHILSTERFHIKCDIMNGPFYDKLYYLTRVISRILGKPCIMSMEEMLEKYKESMKKEVDPPRLGNVVNSRYKILYLKPGQWLKVHSNTNTIEVRGIN